MKDEKEIRYWIAKLQHECNELESKLNRFTPVEKQEEIAHKVSDKQIEMHHYRRCLGETE